MDPSFSTVNTTKQQAAYAAHTNIYKTRVYHLKA